MRIAQEEDYHMSYFSQILAELMNKFDINDQKLADDLGVDRSTVSRWRKGERSPKLDALPKIANYFSVSPRDFVEDIPYTKSGQQSVQKELHKRVEGLNSNSYVAFDEQETDEFDERDKELLIDSLENSLRLISKIAKK